MNVAMKSTGVLYEKIRKAYITYLEMYKKMNKGSVIGATPFSDFYLYKTYYSRYSDVKRLSLNTYR